jgi:SAM-dependent methyltransferase
MIRGYREIRQEYSRTDVAEGYIDGRFTHDPFGRRTHHRQVRILRDIWERLAPSRVLELAPGPARLTTALPQARFACAVEQSPTMIQVAVRRLSEASVRWNVVRGDGFSLPIIDDSFDLALSFRLVRHFPRLERTSLLREMHRVVRPGGRVIIDVANDAMYRWHFRKLGIDQAKVDDYWFSETEFRDEMRAAGFDVEEMHAVHVALPMQHYLWGYLAPRSEGLANVAADLIESVSRSSPLEWVAVSRCA